MDIYATLCSASPYLAILVVLLMAALAYCVWRYRHLVGIGQQVHEQTRQVLLRFGCQLDGEKCYAQKSFAGLGQRFSVADAAKVMVQQTMAAVDVVDPEEQRRAEEAQMAAAAARQASAGPPMNQPNPFVPPPPPPSQQPQGQYGEDNFNIQPANMGGGAAMTLPGTGLETSSARGGDFTPEYSPNP